MKKIVLTVVLLLTVSFAFATNEVEKASILNVEDTLSVEFIKTDFVIESSTHVNTKNQIDKINNTLFSSIILADCFGYAILMYENMESLYGPIDDGEGAGLMNFYYAYCEQFME